MVKRQPNVEASSATFGDDRPVNTEAEGEVRLQRQVRPGKLTPLGHLKDRQEQQWFVGGLGRRERGQS